MSATRLGQSITFTAGSDAYTGVVFLAGLTLQVTSGSAGDRLLVTDTAGSIVADYMVTGTVDNADLMNGRPPFFCQGLLVATFPSGTAVLTAFTA